MIKTVPATHRKLGQAAVVFAVLAVVILFGNEDFSSCAGADKTSKGRSTEPIAAHLEKIGNYKDRSDTDPPSTQPGDVLEYRVWLSPENGGEPLNGSHSYYYAFAQYERAKHFSEQSRGASPPVVVRSEHGRPVERSIFNNVAELPVESRK